MTTVTRAKNESFSSKTVRRAEQGKAEAVPIEMLPGATLTTVDFSEIAEELHQTPMAPRPNRSYPINQDLGGFTSVDEKLAWDAASDEAWGSLDE